MDTEFSINFNNSEDADSLPLRFDMYLENKILLSDVYEN